MPTLTSVETNFAASAHRTVTVEQVIASTPGPIWAALVDNPGWTTWYPGMKRCESTSDPAHGVGSTRTVEVGGLKAEETFVAWEPEKLWAFTITKTNLPMAKRFLEQVELIAGDGVTAARYTGAFEPMLITKPLAGLIERQIRTAWTNGLAGLAAHVTSTS
jgi:uncharacterized protein YndB with AHSA1/START domain